jgi:hypothetical protein
VCPLVVATRYGFETVLSSSVPLISYIRFIDGICKRAIMQGWGLGFWDFGRVYREIGDLEIFIYCYNLQFNVRSFNIQRLDFKIYSNRIIKIVCKAIFLSFNIKNKNHLLYINISII